MNILFSSHVFAPGVGGIEQMSLMLAGEFVRQGHEVTLVTQAQSAEADDYPFTVHRRPDAMQLLKLLRRCDVFFHNNISLRQVWPLALVRKPWVVAHHIWIPHTGFAARLKRALLRCATAIAVSRALADDMPGRPQVIPNAYDDAVFKPATGQSRDCDLVFVGRLVSDKGASLLLSALQALGQQGLRPTLTLVGAGPEEPALRAQLAAEGLADQVVFAGVVRGAALASLLSRHKVMVVPSLWNEPFGIVALEGMACGCVVVGSQGGGLSEAIGPGGLTFANGDVGALTEALRRVLTDAGLQQQLRLAGAQHALQHTVPQIAQRYLAVLEQACV
jgi:glycogen synthase